MSRRGDSLNVVGGVFANREMALARQLGQRETELRAATLQLNELCAHRRRLSDASAGEASTDPGRMQNRQAFYARLGDAIRQQELAVQAARAGRDEARRLWVLSRQKKTAIDKVCARRETQRRRQQEKREQQASDERSARRHHLN